MACAAGKQPSSACGLGWRGIRSALAAIFAICCGNDRRDGAGAGRLRAAARSDGRIRKVRADACSAQAAHNGRKTCASFLQERCILVAVDRHGMSTEAHTPSSLEFRHNLACHAPGCCAGCRWTRALPPARQQPPAQSGSVRRTPRRRTCARRAPATAARATAGRRTAGVRPRTRASSWRRRRRRTKRSTTPTARTCRTRCSSSCQRATKRGSSVRVLLGAARLRNSALQQSLHEQLATPQPLLPQYHRWLLPRQSEHHSPCPAHDRALCAPVQRLGGRARRWT